MGFTESAILFKFQLIRRIFFVFRCRIIPALAGPTRKSDYISHSGPSF